MKLLKKIRIILFILFLANIFVFSEDDFSKILSRLKEDTSGKIYKTETIKSFFQNKKKDGSWNDINYDDKSRTIWDPTKHLDRLANIAGLGFKTEWENNDSKKYKDSINLGVDFWLTKAPKSDNWRFNRIGAPQNI